MKFSKLAAAVAVTSMTASAMAGGPLFIHDETMKPYKWDTSNGAIPVYTDGGMVDGNGVPTFTMIDAGSVFNIDMTLPDGRVIPAGTPFAQNEAFLTIAQANQITAHAIGEWSNVATSTLDLQIEDTIESQTGIADVTGDNAGEIYDQFNGGGFYVNYDTDGSILENYFGVPKSAVLGIAFPEWANEETGEITEATAVMNGWFVDATDNNGEMVAGVFTHEFGHAINMSHSEANGQFTYAAAPWAPKYDGVPGCSGVNVYGPSRFQGGSVAPFTSIETMFPFINVRSDAGRQQSTVNVRDDIVNISDLYPTADYKANYGTIKGKLFTKEGVEYSGINMIARNLDDPFEDVVSQQSGNLTQGRVGPDGSFEINGLTPGGRYVLYTAQISAGGYPTTPTAIVSESEYWNEDESANPAVDGACDVTEIVLTAGETKEVEMHFNGYTDGIQYTPLVQAFILDHSKNGKRALGSTSGGALFLYDSTKKDIFYLPAFEDGRPVFASAGTAMNKTATVAAAVSDYTGNGVQTPVTWSLRSNKMTAIEDPSNGTCTLGSSSGVASASIWDIDDEGKTIAGNYRQPYEIDGPECEEGNAGASVGVPAIWKDGKVQTLGGVEFVEDWRGLKREAALLDEDGNITRTAAWIRADRIAGNGTTVTGMTNGSNAVAWVNGQLVDTYTKFGARESSVISADGQYVGINVRGEGIKIWNTETDELREIGNLEYCTDVPYIHFRFGNLCDRFGAQFVWDNVGRYLDGTLLDATEDLSMITVRSGSFFTGFTGAIYLEGVGWMTTNDFFNKQGVVEARGLMTDNPFGLSANGSEMMVGLAGATVSIDVDANKAFVCDKGRDRELSFPKQVVAAVKKGAEFGRCAHLND